MNRKRPEGFYETLDKFSEANRNGYFDGKGEVFIPKKKEDKHDAGGVMSKITKSFEITTSPEVMERFERFLALLHWNSCFGHSAAFGMWLDGDGNDKVSISPEPKHSKEVNLIGGVGDGVEVATYNGYGFIHINRDSSEWTVKEGRLYRNGEDWEQRKKILRRIRENKNTDFGPVDME